MSIHFFYARVCVCISQTCAITRECARVYRARSAYIEEKEKKWILRSRFSRTKAVIIKFAGITEV